MAKHKFKKPAEDKSSSKRSAEDRKHSRYAPKAVSRNKAVGADALSGAAIPAGTEGGEV